MSKYGLFPLQKNSTYIRKYTVDVFDRHCWHAAAEWAKFGITGAVD